MPPSPVPKCTCDASGIAIGLVGLVKIKEEGEGAIKKEDLEAAVLKLARDVPANGNSNSRLLSGTKVNSVTLASTFDVGEFRGAETNRFDVELTRVALVCSLSR
jgi:hypothetical protein